MSKSQPRGIRNNNPGNIDRTPKRTAWQGRVPDNALTDPRFEQFEHAKWGIRAICRTLITYQDKHELNSVREIIDRWAPPVENNTEAYIQAVARKIGVAPDEAISVHEYDVMRELVVAIISHENGQQPYSGADIDEGLRLAGVVPAKAKPASRDPVNVGGAVALAGAGAEVASRVAGSSEAAEVAEQSDLLSEALPLMSMIGGWALTLTVVAAVGLLAYRWWQRRQGVE
jgi:hypothetical protein